MTPSTILVIGDSLVQKSLDPSTLGFSSCLAHTYSSHPIDILVRGIPGSNSRWLFREPNCLLDDIIHDIQTKPLRISLAILLVGANDSLLEDTPWFVPVDEFVDNVIFAVERLKEVGVERVLVLGCPPIDEAVIKDARKRRSWDRSIAYSESLTLGIKVGFMDDDSVDGIDLAGTMLRKTGWRPDPASAASDENASKWKGMLLDGVHLGRKGNLMVFLLIVQKIKDQWPEITPESLPYISSTPPRLRPEVQRYLCGDPGDLDDPDAYSELVDGS